MKITDKSLTEEMKDAMRAKNKIKLAVLRSLKSAYKNATLENQVDQLDDASTLALLRKQIKQRHEAADKFSKADRQELSDKELAEAKILENYLPKQLSQAEIEKCVRETIDELDATDKSQMGAVMKSLQAKTKGLADNKILSQEVLKRLN